MPELPEVETIRRTLIKKIVGRKIRDVEIRKSKIFQGDKKRIKGKIIRKIKRRGKILIIELSGGQSLVIHFKLTGQIVWVEDDQKRVNEEENIILGHPIPFAGTKLPAKTTHVIFNLDGGKLFYNDLRQFGWIRVRDKKEIEDEIKNLGVEPLSKEFTVEYLEKIFSKTQKPIKLVLMDQRKIAGIGNIYANEALFEAGILPNRPANSLNQEMIRRLYRAIIRVLEEGLKYGGSSAKDEAYIKPTGESGKYQEHFRVYQRKGEKCSRCGRLIERTDLGGRGTFFCVNCQR